MHSGSEWSISQSGKECDRDGCAEASGDRISKYTVGIWNDEPVSFTGYFKTAVKKNEIRRGYRWQIFEEFSRRVSDVASDITKKTGDTLEIQKIKSNVRTLKRANERDLADMVVWYMRSSRVGEVSDMDNVTLCEEIEKTRGRD